MLTTCPPFVCCKILVLAISDLRLQSPARTHTVSLVNPVLSRDSESILEGCLRAFYALPITSGERAHLKSITHSIVDIRGIQRWIITGQKQTEDNGCVYRASHRSLVMYDRGSSPARVAMKVST